jgi:glucokinase
LATLAEFRWGAGQGRRSIFYVTAGTGVGGGCVLDGKLLGRGRPAIAEIGHLRPGLDATNQHATVESLSSGWGIAAFVRQALREIQTGAAHSASDAADLWNRCGHDEHRITSLLIAEAARAGNSIALKAIDQACRALGWGIAQVITLLAPERIVVGGGVPHMGDQLFLDPVRRYAQTYVFPPLADSYDIVPAGLGDQVVVHGAIALAAEPAR